MFERICRLMSVSGGHKVPVIVALVVLAILLPELVFAQETALPYEKGLGQFQESLQGPVPFAISLVGIVACGAMLIFGGEISGFLRTMVFIVLVVAVMVQASSVVSILGGKKSLVPVSLYVPQAQPADVA